MLAVVDEEVGLGALRQRVLARVRVGRPLRHLASRSLARLLRSAANRSGVRAWGGGRALGHGCSGGGNRAGDLRRRRGDEGRDDVEAAGRRTRREELLARSDRGGREGRSSALFVRLKHDLNTCRNFFKSDHPLWQ